MMRAGQPTLAFRAVVDRARSADAHEGGVVWGDHVGHLGDLDVEPGLPKPVDVVGTIAPDVILLSEHPQAIGGPNDGWILERPVQRDGYQENGPAAPLEDPVD